MHFEGEFRVPGKPGDVIRRFADVPRMASCMPGAVLEPQNEDGSWPGAMVVAFGPKKIAFKGRVTCAFDEAALSGTLQGRGTANLRAARIGVTVDFSLRGDPAAASPTTVVKIVSDAELGGVLADFARTGGVAVANVIMADFARRAAEEFAKDTPPEPETATRETAAEKEPTAARMDPPTPARRPDPVPLAAHGLIWAVIKAWFAGLARRLGLGG
jgi:carbon monoxide dehydrogenase subunit G